ncbi:MAG: tetratricopeptide repeat protein [Gammaproteobacteria bacterium]|nr:tetratricopeptide repeat protein [Rhodocyclaceae bacterium]MBU3908218.1 tetratricopeptide repeat protein [Gammaproteobacteria bacterium]MBU3989137.1 tetratricopeptide repeat protein [Gammaproteobacteria bacterium]MBU4003145.1 tetratricopeptide repeat protein [Gammaproteobacteria bacterium]MBU4019987.1 tetratricopeptide repeat protein [Gammaproteobacteria bacterium]
MDALRKAEQQKRDNAVQGQSPRQTEVSAKLALEPLSTQADPAPAKSVPADGTSKAGSTRLPELPTRLEDLDAQFITPASRVTQAARPATASQKTEPAVQRESGSSNIDSSRETARALFAAKHPAPKDSRNFSIAVGLITLVATVGIGGYFWWQMQQVGQPIGNLATSGMANMRPPPAPPSPAVSGVAPPAAASVSEQPARSTSTPEYTARAATIAPSAGNADNQDRQTPRREAEKPAPSPVAAARPADAIRVSAAPQKLNPALEQAFLAFNRGELDLAQATWQKVLESDPKNSDALYGLAAVAMQHQQPNRAADFYLRALEANPKDALALSGLISLRGHVDPQQTESRLKNLLAEQPDSPFLNFALGNLYARSTRWADAQQAYFKAHVADPQNPDYLFNLAVSLDQLRQARLAIQYYNQALGAAAQQPVGFDPVQVAVRLKILQSSQQP